MAFDRAAFEEEMRREIERGQEVMKQEAVGKYRATLHKMSEGDGGYDAEVFGADDD